MATITFITPDEETVVVRDAEGTLMSVGVANNVKGIDGDCGGVCSCATCHVQVDPAWMDKVGAASENEMGLLELEDEVSEFSRLGCQVRITSELDGLVVRVVGR